MNTNFHKVKEFMAVMGQEVKSKPKIASYGTCILRLALIKEEVKATPKIADYGTCTLRLALIQEELDELKEALLENDIVETADAIADILYVVYGTAVAFGIGIDEVFEEVHSSNMSKLDVDGTAIFDEMGKVMKGPDYFRPNIAQVLLQQGISAL